MMNFEEISTICAKGWEQAEKELKELQIKVDINKNHRSLMGGKTVVVYLMPILVKGNKAMLDTLRANNWWSTYTLNRNGVQTKVFRKDFTVA